MSASEAATRIGLLALIVLSLAGCAGDAAPDPLAPGADSFEGMVSEPVGGAAAASTMLALNGGGAAPLAWLSLPPGTEPDGLAATIVNGRTSGSLVVPMVDGGFDPVAIPALAGDLLEISIALEGGGTALTKAAVPVRRRPRVVRTSPARGRLDVAINSSIIVIFSEPIADSSAAPARIRLVGGDGPVAGTVARVEGSAVGVAFTPAEPLDPGTPYRIELAEDIVDLSGDRLDGERSFDFSTATLPGTPPPAEPPPAEPPPSEPPPSGAISFWGYPEVVNWGIAPQGGERIVTIYADRAAATAEFLPSVRDELAFVIYYETCSAGWREGGNHCEVRIGLFPSGAPRDYSGRLVLADASGIRVSVPLFGTTAGAPLTVEANGTLPSELMAGLVSDPIQLTVRNVSADLTSEPLETRHLDCTFWIDSGCTTASPDFSGIQVTGDTCDGVVLAPGASCTLQVAFAPKGLIYYTASLQFDRAATATFAVGGLGTGLVAGPQRFDFPLVSVGASVVGGTVVTNLGDQPTGVITAELDPGPFSLVAEADECTGRQLGPGQSCSVSFRYNPTESGRHSAALWFRASPGGPQVAQVTGQAQ